MFYVSPKIACATWNITSNLATYGKPGTHRPILPWHYILMTNLSTYHMPCSDEKIVEPQQ